MRDREAKARGRLILRESRFDSGRLEASERVPHKRQERAAGAVELDGVRTTVDQVNADPLLQRPNVARECRLRDGARFSGPREVTRLGERDKVLEPIEVQRTVVGSHRYGVNSSMQF